MFNRIFLMFPLPSNILSNVSSSFSPRNLIEFINPSRNSRKECKMLDLEFDGWDNVTRMTSIERGSEAIVNWQFCKHLAQGQSSRWLVILWPDEPKPQVVGRVGDESVTSLPARRRWLLPSDLMPCDAILAEYRIRPRNRAVIQLTPHKVIRQVGTFFHV